jgi:hypothetical protein
MLSLSLHISWPNWITNDAFLQNWRAINNNNNKVIKLNNKK